MKKNVFRLKSFLRIKEFEEKNAWTEVLAQESRIQKIDDQIKELLEQRKQGRKKASLFGLRGGPVIGELELIEESIAANHVKIEQLKTEKVREQKVLEKLKLKHLEAKKELKTIEKLKEKNLQQYKNLRQKVDVKNTVEIAQQMYLRERVENE